MSTNLEQVLDSLLIAPDYSSWKELWEEYVALNPKKSLNIKLSPPVKTLRRKRSRSLSDIRVYDSIISDINNDINMISDRGERFVSGKADHGNFKMPLPPEERQSGHICAVRGLRKKRSRSLNHRETSVVKPVWTSFQSHAASENLREYEFEEKSQEIPSDKRLKRKMSWQSKNETQTCENDSSDFEDQPSYRVLFSSSDSTKRLKHFPDYNHENANPDIVTPEDISQDLNTDSLIMPKDAFIAKWTPNGKRFYCTFKDCEKCIFYLTQSTPEEA